jgi:3-oxoacyl-[acyl-carrier-protein] synthase II
VIVSGVGCISSLGSTREAFTRGLIDGRSGIAPIVDFDVSSCRTKHAGCVIGFDPTEYLPPLKLRRVDAVARLALAATRDALAAAALLCEKAECEAIGVVLGSYSAGVHATGEYLEGYLKGGPTGAPALLFSSTVGNAPASQCGLEYGLRGPNTTLMHKEASGLSAIAFGTHLIRRGKASAIVAGGADDIDERFYRVHDWFGVMAPSLSATDETTASDARPCSPNETSTKGRFSSNNSSAGAPRTAPFDGDRTGFVMGEGGFMLVVEDEDARVARGGPVLAEVVGTGASASSCAVNAWPADEHALVRAMTLALEDGGLSPEDVDVIYASANGTRVLDHLEALAIRTVFGQRNVAVTSIKGALGEFGGVGAASAAAAILCGREGLIAPTIGCRRPASDVPLAVVRASAPISGPIALVNSFASGGTNFSVVLRVLPA